jgi:hypothetical protein
MRNIILEQLIYEVDTWKRLIVFIKNENLMRINRLNDIIKSNDDKNILHKIENFQVQFMMLEEIYFVLNNEVVEQQNRLMLVYKKEYEIDIIPFTQVNRTSNGYEFNLDTSWLIPQDYYLQLRLKNGDYYEGEFENCLMNGWGELRDASHLFL